MQNFVAKRKKKLKINIKNVLVNLNTYEKLLNHYHLLGLPNKSGGCIVSDFAENKIVKHDTKTILKAFKKFYSNFSGDL